MSKSKFIIEKRRQLSKIINSVRKLKSGREVSLVITKLEEAFMMLGLVLKFIGETEYPYQAGNDKSTKAIDAAKDKSENALEDLKEGDEIYNIKLLREILGSFELSLTPAMIGGTLNADGQIWLNESKKSVTLARLWLGMELGKHRDEVSGLSWEEAEKELNEGNLIRLPGMEGFFFKHLKADKILLLQFGDIFGDKNIEERLEGDKSSNDWELAAATEDQKQLLDSYFVEDPISHEVTDSDIVNNPKLVEQGVKEGDVIEIPAVEQKDKVDTSVSEGNDTEQAAAESVTTEKATAGKSSKKAAKGK